MAKVRTLVGSEDAMSYRVKLDVFEGRSTLPTSSRRKVDIWLVSRPHHRRIAPEPARDDEPRRGRRVSRDGGDADPHQVAHAAASLEADVEPDEDPRADWSNSWSSTSAIARRRSRSALGVDPRRVPSRSTPDTDQSEGIRLRDVTVADLLEAFRRSWSGAREPRDVRGIGRRGRPADRPPDGDGRAVASVTLCRRAVAAAWWRRSWPSSS